MSPNIATMGDSAPQSRTPPSPSPALLNPEDYGTNFSLKESVVRRVEKSHSRVPGLRNIPLRALGIILLVAVVNAGVWVAAGVVLVCIVSLLASFRDFVGVRRCMLTMNALAL